MTDGTKQFKSTLLYEAQGPATKLQADLLQIREFDKDSEARLSVYRKMTLISGLFSVGGFIGSFLFPLAVVILVFAAVPLAIGIVLWTVNAKYDLQNRRYELFGELLRILGRDMAREAPFTVRLDLSRPNVKRKKAGTGTSGPWKVTYYNDTWLTLSGRFVDGTAFQISMTERFQARGKWKRGRSGKNKYKTKTKSTTQASVRLRAKAKRYENLPQVTSKTPELLRLPPWVRAKNVSGTDDELQVTGVIGDNWSVHPQSPSTDNNGVEMLAMMLLSLYQVLHASTAMSKS